MTCLQKPFKFSTVLSSLLLAASLLSLQGCVPIGQTPQSKALNAFDPEALKKEQEEHKKAVDQLFANARAAGKAIVVTTTASLDTLQFDFKNNDSAAEFAKLRSANVLWRNAANPDQALNVGYDTDINRDPKGSYFQNGFGRAIYKIYLVDPGHYSLDTITYNLPRIPPNEPLGEPPIYPSSLGFAILSPFKLDEFDHGQAWHDATYESTTHHESVCIQVMMPENRCISWGDSSYNVEQQTSNAGWRDTTEKREVRGRAVSITLNRPFATFDVAAGEAIMIDGFYPEPPSSGLKPGSCQQATDTSMRCELSETKLAKIPAKVADFNQSVHPAQYGLPGVAAALVGIVYRPVSIMAKKTSASSQWGQSYVLKEK
ncbi:MULTISPECIES: hypothetical protein [unclassified Pseudomonas]|uniref:hypothetical protein n=1 Tax=unclassified Pseudomonas TaxID=196821 RepID=UPI0025E143B0|nr:MULTISPECIES: hypothetical protein [unclassified Pseudomonas]